LHPPPRRRNCSALDAAEQGVMYCEVAQCDGTVGYGGSPDTNGETTLDALVMDGRTMDMGAVGYLRNIKSAVSTARRVMEYSSHSLLCGDGAAAFSNMSGFPLQSLETQGSNWTYGNWTLAHCQPNYYVNWVDGNTTCGPYTPVPTPSYTPMPGVAAEWVVAARAPGDAAGAAAAAGGAAPSARPSPRHGPNPNINEHNHDSLGMCTMDVAGNIALGMSSNGANHKVAGRVGDVPVVGAGGYADNTAGCAAATGDGDITMRFLPAFFAVEQMRAGASPADACQAAVARIIQYYPVFTLGLVCMDTQGNYGAASYGWTFSYAAAAPDTGGKVVTTAVTSLPTPLPTPVAKR
jgi:isoaspartyl peptidase/L-asparaginase-like protein (Ntn-hydrolase superfamily)